MNSCRIFMGKIVLVTDDEYYEVELYSDMKKLKKNRGYLKDGYVYIYRGKIKSNNDIKESGIYELRNEKVFTLLAKDKEKYNVNNIVELDPNKIFEVIKQHQGDFLTESDIELINTNAETFLTTIKVNDDFLKRAIKQAINLKQINLKAYREKFKNEHSLNNMKSALNKSSRMTVSYFLDWCEILGLNCELTVKDNGNDKISPLKETIYVTIN